MCHGNKACIITAVLHNYTSAVIENCLAAEEMLAQCFSEPLSIILAQRFSNNVCAKQGEKALFREEHSVQSGQMTQHCMF